MDLCQTEIKMTTRLLSELEQDSFEPNEFVERLAWRTTSQNASSSVGVSLNDGGDFDAQSLHEAFHKAIEELNDMQEKQKAKCQTLEKVRTAIHMKTKTFKH